MRRFVLLRMWVIAPLVQRRGRYLKPFRWGLSRRMKAQSSASVGDRRGCEGVEGGGREGGGVMQGKESPTDRWNQSCSRVSSVFSLRLTSTSTHTHKSRRRRDPDAFNSYTHFTRGRIGDCRSFELLTPLQVSPSASSAGSDPFSPLELQSTPLKCGEVLDTSHEGGMQRATSLLRNKSV